MGVSQSILAVTPRDTTVFLIGMRRVVSGSRKEA